MKFSIIIPIYNAEKYLNKCLDSIISQKYNKYEVILINDGSVDNSKEICENYCKLNNQFKLINQKNQGVSSARNNGLKKSKGDLILFIDSDDILEENALEIIVDNFKKNDLLCFGYSELYKGKKNAVVFDKIINDKNEIEKRIVLNDKIGGYLWNKCFRANIIKINNLLFDENLHFCEDLVFVVDYFKYCNKVKYINKILYIYRMRKGSVTFDFFNKKNISILNSYEK